MQRTATLLPRGRVLVLGGGGPIYGGTEEEVVVLVGAGETAEIYDPASDTWTLTPPPKFHHTWASTVAPISHGRVMAIGSQGAEIYKESNDTWTVIDDPVQRGFHTATALQDGSVLITGGYDATYFANPDPHERGVVLLFVMDPRLKRAVGSDDHGVGAPIVDDEALARVRGIGRRGHLARGLLAGEVTTVRRRIGRRAIVRAIAVGSSGARGDQGGHLRSSGCSGRCSTILVATRPRS
ncbi:hypothetical protein AB3662_16725 [Sorangium cellulosum]|uniref:hypothetical protein n=1 Tax=Sorangium cellulosum TaxID=56 RepID=UPI003D9A23EF